MDILPINLILEEDFPLAGEEVTLLSKLARLELPVARGIAVFPPEIELLTVLKHYNLSDREIFEQSLTLMKKEIFHLPVPENLKEILKNETVDIKKIWSDLLEIWVNRIRDKIWNEGFKQDLYKSLQAQTIFFVDKISVLGQAYFEYESEKLVCELERGMLGEEEEAELKRLVLEADKKLLIDYRYHFLVEEKKRGEVKIVRVTHKFERDKDLNAELEKIYNSPKSLDKLKKTVTKVYLELSRGFVIERDVDGILIASEKSVDFDESVLKLLEAATTFSSQEVIFKLSDEKGGIGGVRGCLKLIHNQKLLKKDAEVFLFARNKKRLLNVSVAIPLVRSVNEYLQIKRDLATLGISRKGSLKFHLEICVPENVLNLEDYLTAGIDGVILNLDEVAAFLGGFDPDSEAGFFYNKQVGALLKFIEPAIRLIHKTKLSFLASGRLSEHHDVITFLVREKIDGIIVDNAGAATIREYLHFLEKRHFSSKL